MSEGIIDFPLEKNAVPVQKSLVYRPWSVRTLKIKVSTAVTTPKLRLRPRIRDQREGIFCGYPDDNSQSFVISWGGGHELGPCIKAKDSGAVEECDVLTTDPKKVSMIFFNLNHVGPEVPDSTTLTLEAYEPENGSTYATLVVTLQKPDSFSGEETVRFIQDGSNANLWRAKGSKLAVYDSRWWPEAVTYTETDALPLSIERKESTLFVNWGNKVVANIADRTKFVVADEKKDFSFELFHFDEWNLTLRVWFFWLDKSIGKNHEVPDAERFDLIIRRSDGWVTVACTDLHWREVWGEVVPDVVNGQVVRVPLRASIGLTRGALFHMVETKAGDIGDKLISLLKGEDKDTRIHNPVQEDGLVRRMAEKLGQKDRIDRAAGIESHVPMLENVDQPMPKQMTSSDVRVG